MRTIALSAAEAQSQIIVHERIRAGEPVPDTCHGIETSDTAMLVDPINSSPYIFSMPATIIAFDFKPGDGTDHIRQRALAATHFRNHFADDGVSLAKKRSP